MLSTLPTTIASSHKRDSSGDRSFQSLRSIIFFTWSIIFIPWCLTKTGRSSREGSIIISSRKGLNPLNLLYNFMDRRTLLDALVSDGRFLLIFTAIILVLSGLFVIVQSLTGHFLPHDVSYLGLDALELSEFNNGAITRFMFHDRISFGGSIMAVGFLYMWLAEFPLKNGEGWAWYLFLFSGIIGFGSFLTYLGYGYFDTWHGTATALLLPFFVTGMIRSRALIKTDMSLKDVLKSKEKFSLRTRFDTGKSFLLFSSLGMLAAGLTIMTV